MKIKHIAFTMYPVKDMSRARKFYEKVLGLKTGKDFGGGKSGSSTIRAAPDASRSRR